MLFAPLGVYFTLLLISLLHCIHIFGATRRYCSVLFGFKKKSTEVDVIESINISL